MNNEEIEQEDEAEKKEQKLYINQLTESLQLSSLIFAPIFMPRKNGYKLISEEDIESVTFQRTKKNIIETITYNGNYLDISTDFPLFSILVSYTQMKQKLNFSLTEKEFFRVINKQYRTSSIKSLKARLQKLRRCHIYIEYTDESGEFLRGIDTNLIDGFDWNRTERKIDFSMSKHFMSLELKHNDKELIRLSDYNYIKTDYAKALFLYLETRKFKAQKSINFRKQDLIDRFATNVKTNKEKNRELKNALKALENSTYLAGFSYYKSEIQYIPMVKIVRREGGTFLDLFG